VFKFIRILVLLPVALPVAAFAAPPADWTLKGNTPTGVLCRAVRLNDATADIQLLRNNQGRIVISIGHPDWSLPTSPTPVPVELSADDEARVTLQGYPIDKIVLVVIPETLEQSVRKARVLRWRLPWGDFATDVSGLGDAFDAISVCPT
jgi:hypothetical protein